MPEMNPTSEQDIINDSLPEEFPNDVDRFDEENVSQEESDRIIHENDEDNDVTMPDEIPQDMDEIPQNMEQIDPPDTDNPMDITNETIPEVESNDNDISVSPETEVPMDTESVADTIPPVENNEFAPVDNTQEYETHQDTVARPEDDRDLSAIESEAAMFDRGPSHTIDNPDLHYDISISIENGTLADTLSNVMDDITNGIIDMDVATDVILDEISNAFSTDLDLSGEILHDVFSSDAMTSDFLSNLTDKLETQFSAEDIEKIADAADENIITPDATETMIEFGQFMITDDGNAFNQFTGEALPVTDDSLDNISNDCDAATSDILDPFETAMNDLEATAMESSPDISDATVNDFMSDVFPDVMDQVDNNTFQPSNFENDIQQLSQPENQDVTTPDESVHSMDMPTNDMADMPTTDDVNNVNSQLETPTPDDVDNSNANVEIPQQDDLMVNDKLEHNDITNDQNNNLSDVTQEMRPQADFETPGNDYHDFQNDFQNDFDYDNQDDFQNDFDSASLDDAAFD